MNRTPSALALLLMAFALPSAAQNTQIPSVSLTPTLGSGAGASIYGGPGSLTSPTALTLSGPLLLTPSISVIPSPNIAPTELVAKPVAFSASVSPAAAKTAFTGGTIVPTALAPKTAGVTPAEKVAPTLEAIELAASKRDRRRGQGDDDGRQFFDGGKIRSAAPVSAKSKQQSPFIKNADGVWVGGRAAEQANWINKMTAQLSGVIDLSDVLDVMDDAYDEARVKLKSAEKAASDRNLEATSVHLEGTRNWVDAIVTDADDEAIAVHTHRVYFHPAPGHPESEIAEGIRRAYKYLEKVKVDFSPNGQAETEMDTHFSKVELTFDTRGYKAIEDAIRTKEKEFQQLFGDRFIFKYHTEPKMPSKQLRAEYNAIVERFMDQPEGLMQIIEGVTYSREVGVGHELNSHLKRLAMGLKITQAGRDFFDKDGHYVTEFDGVTVKESADGKEVTLWEDKSARVWLPLPTMMEETFLYKLRIYRANRALIEESLGAPLRVAFSVDVGGTVRRAAKQGVLVWQDERSKELMEYLQANQDKLSKEYGFPVSFIFVNSHPGESPDLFSQKPMSLEEWKARNGGGGKGGKGGKGRGRR